MNLEPFTGPGSTPSRRRFWDKVTSAVIACQKVEGNNVTVSEHQGAGTLINVNRVRGLEGGVGACCYDDGTCDDLTEADCNDAGGNWQGTGTTCADDPNPCIGACCEGEVGTTCVENSTPDSCAADGGTFQDFGSTCDPDPCGEETTGACCIGDDCFILSSDDCAASMGIYAGNGVPCSPSPCGGVLGTCCFQDVIICEDPDFQCGDCIGCTTFLTLEDCALNINPGTFHAGVEDCTICGWPDNSLCVCCTPPSECDPIEGCFDP